jgi:hypothetical protein
MDRTPPPSATVTSPGPDNRDDRHAREAPAHDDPHATHVIRRLAGLLGRAAAREWRMSLTAPSAEPTIGSPQEDQ